MSVNQSGRQSAKKLQDCRGLAQMPIAPTQNSFAGHLFVTSELDHEAITSC